MTKYEIYERLLKVSKTLSPHTESYNEINFITEELAKDVVKPGKTTNNLLQQTTITKVKNDSQIFEPLVKINGHNLLLHQYMVVDVKCEGTGYSFIKPNLDDKFTDNIERMLSTEYETGNIIRLETDDYAAVDELCKSKRKNNQVIRKFSCGLVLNCMYYRYALALTGATYLYVQDVNSAFCLPVYFPGESYDVYLLPMCNKYYKHKAAGFDVVDRADVVYM